MAAGRAVTLGASCALGRKPIRRPAVNARLDANTLQADPALSHISEQWDKDILRQLTDYIAIPAKSPGFDGDWEKNGFIDTVVRNAASWVEAQKVAGLKLEVVRAPGRTPGPLT